MERNSFDGKAKIFKGLIGGLGCWTSLGFWIFGMYGLTKIYSFKEFELYLNGFYLLIKYSILIGGGFLLIGIIFRNFFPNLNESKTGRKFIKGLNRERKKIVSNVFTKHTSLFYLLLFIILIGLFYVIDLKYFNDQNPFKDILVEAHGLIFDVLIFGILLSIYEKFKVNNETINRNIEKLEDYRGWKSSEASNIISASLRRLSKQYRLQLIESYLRNSNLAQLFLPEAILLKCDLREVDFSDSKITDGYILFCDFKKAICKNSTLEGLMILECDFSHTIFCDSNFSNTTLLGVDFSNADLTNCIFDNTIVSSKNWFEELKNKKVKGIDRIMDLYKISKSSHKISLIHSISHAKDIYPSTIKYELNKWNLNSNMKLEAKYENVYEVKKKMNAGGNNV